MYALHSQPTYRFIVVCIQYVEQLVDDCSKVFGAMEVVVFEVVRPRELLRRRTEVHKQVIKHEVIRLVDLVRCSGRGPVVI
jgi:hypothetical protein